MKNLKVITIFAVFLVGISATSLLGQGRHARTRGAKAAYGYPVGEYPTKKKQKQKKKKKKQPKATKKKGKQPAYRKKNPWAS